MSLSFSCQSCGNRYKVDEALAGKRVKCKGCDDLMSIPSPTPEGRAPDLFDDLDNPGDLAAPAWGRDSNAEPDPDFAPIPRLKASRSAPAPGRSGKPSEGMSETTKLLIGGGLGTVLAILVFVFFVVRPSGSGQGQAPADGGAPGVNLAPGVAAAPVPGEGGNRSIAPGFTRNEPRALIAQSRWRSLADPPTEPVASLIEKDLDFALPRGAGKDNLYYPSTYSPFFAVESRSGAQTEIDLWDLRSERRAGRIGGEARIDRQVNALDPEGKYMATRNLLTGGKSIDIHGFADGGKVATITLENHPDYVEFAGPDQVVIGATFQKAFEVWDVRAGQRVATFPVPARPEKESLTVSPGGRYLVMCASEDDRLRAYDLHSGQLLNEIELPAEGHNRVTCKGMAFSPDGSELAGLFEVASKPLIICWNTASGEAEAEHRFDSRDDLPNPSGYNFRAIDWLTFHDAWLIRGETVVDRQSGQKVWRFPFDNENQVAGARRMQSPDKLLTLSGSHSRGFALRSTPIPDPLKRALEVVRAGGSAIDAILPELTGADRTGVETIAQAGGGSWSAQPDPAPSPSQSLAARPIPIRAKGQVQRVLFSAPETGQALVVIRQGGVIQKQDDPNRVERYDLASGRLIAGFDLAPGLEPIAFSPDGSTVLTRDAEGRVRLDAWSIESNEGKHVAGWRPFGEETEAARQVAWAAFLDLEHVLTVSGAGDLVLWELPTCRAVYEMNGVGSGEPLLSPGRSDLALFEGSTVRLIDARTGASKGETAAALSSEDLTAAAFSTDGAELIALIGGSQVVRWSMAGGEMIDEFASPVSGQQRIQYCGSDHALIDGRALVDLGRQKPAWNYFGVEPVEGSPDGRFWYVVGSGVNAASLAAVELPTAEVASTVALAEDPKTPALLKPGMTISLQLNIPGPPKDPKVYLQSIADRYADRLREKGVNVANGQPVKLVISAREADTGETMELRNMMPRPGESPLATQSIPIQRIEYKVALIDGQGQVSVVPKQQVELPSFNIFRILQGEDAATHIRQQLWENARDRMTGGAVPEFVSRQGNRVVTLPGSTDLSRPTR